MLRLHDIAILEARNPCFQVPPGELHVTEITPQHTGAVREAYAVVGHEIAEERVIKRFRSGLRFFQLWHQDTLAGTTWIIVGSRRYLDELAWSLPMHQDELWVRDVYISPKFRGRRLFSSLMGLILANHMRGYRSIWSDVSWRNKASLQAHAKAGFQVRARVRAVDLAGRVIIRSRIISWGEPILEIEPARQIIWLRADRLQMHRELIA